MEFVWIDPGSFMMGPPESEVSIREGEAQHRVTLTKGFFLQSTAVTVGQFRRFVEHTGYATDAERDGSARVQRQGLTLTTPGANWRNPGFEQTDEHPVVCVSWNDAQAFVAWLNRVHPGRGYRLPTEAEWEYTCRSGTTGAWHGEPDDVAWHERNSGGTTQPVGTRAPNAWGLHDMHGNVWEWCADWYGGYPLVGAIDPTGPEDGLTRVLRGGAWSVGTLAGQSAARAGAPPDYRSNSVGFRVVRER